MDTSAYDDGLPCKNPSCKSFGSPHPNCRCYGGGMAEGGSVEPFCSRSRAHEAGCQYFAEGDIVHPEDVVREEPAADIVRPEDVVREGPEADVVAPESVVRTEGPSGPQPAAPETPTGEYETPGQQFLAAHEASARGLLGPLATAGELGLSKLGVPGLSAEDIKGRQEANPILTGATEAASTAVSMGLGVGEAGLAAKAAMNAAKVTKLAATGTALLKDFTQGVVQAGGDELSKMMLGQGNPEHPVGYALAHTALGGLFNMGMGRAFHLVAPAVKNAAAQVPEKAGELLEHYLAGVAMGSQGISGGGLKSRIPIVATPENLKMLEKGVKTGASFVENAQKGIIGSGALAGAGAGRDLMSSMGDMMAAAGTIAGGLAGATAGKIVSGAVTPVLNKANALVYPAMAWALSKGVTKSLSNVMNYAKTVAQGAASMDKAAEAVVLGMGHAIGNGALTEANRAKARDYMEEGGVDQEIQAGLEAQNAPKPYFLGMAKGGEVRAPVAPTPADGSLLVSNGIDQVYPEQNVLLNSVKGRVSNYLNGLRPSKDPPKLAFDTPLKDVKRERDYSHAIDIALDPMSVLHHVQKGTLETSHVAHLQGMYPEVHNMMGKHLTEKIVDAQLKGVKPPYKVRQGLSMLLGTPLSSDLTPAAVAAAQAVFATQKQVREAGKGGEKPKKNESAIRQSDESHRTSGEAAAARAQRGS